jgi:hypothetical protein
VPASKRVTVVKAFCRRARGTRFREGNGVKKSAGNLASLRAETVDVGAPFARQPAQIAVG